LFCGSIRDVNEANGSAQVNPAGIGFAGFSRFAPAETFSGSMRDRKSRTRVGFARFSEMSENRGAGWWMPQSDAKRSLRREFPDLLEIHGIRPVLRSVREGSSRKSDPNSGTSTPNSLKARFALAPYVRAGAPQVSTRRAMPPANVRHRKVLMCILSGIAHSLRINGHRPPAWQRADPDCGIYLSLEPSPTVGFARSEVSRGSKRVPCIPLKA
jgi:hypothetical protein